jgi:hypothetical protein
VRFASSFYSGVALLFRSRIVEYVVGHVSHIVSLIIKTMVARLPTLNGRSGTGAAAECLWSRWKRLLICPQIN